MPDQTIVKQHDDHIDVIQSDNVVEVLEHPEYVEVTGVGIQGIQGEKGDKGDQGDVGQQGEPGTPGTGFVYTHNQMIPSDEWIIDHDLGGHPSVTTVDSTDRVIEGDVEYLSSAVVRVTFSSANSGKAHLS